MGIKLFFKDTFSIITKVPAWQLRLILQTHTQKESPLSTPLFEGTITSKEFRLLRKGDAIGLRNGTLFPVEITGIFEEYPEGTKVEIQIKPTKGTWSFCFAPLLFLAYLLFWAFSENSFVPLFFAILPLSATIGFWLIVRSDYHSNLRKTKKLLQYWFETGKSDVSKPMREKIERQKNINLTYGIFTILLFIGFVSDFIYQRVYSASWLLKIPNITFPIMFGLLVIIFFLQAIPLSHKWKKIKKRIDSMMPILIMLMILVIAIEGFFIVSLLINK